MAGGALDAISEAFNDLTGDKQAEVVADATAAITSKTNDAMAQVQRAGGAFGQTSGRATQGFAPAGTDVA